jgi:hypothetical protein
MISFIAAYLLWANDAGWMWWCLWLILAASNLFYTIANLK